MTHLHLGTAGTKSHGQSTHNPAVSRAHSRAEGGAHGTAGFDAALSPAPSWPARPAPAAAAAKPDPLTQAENPGFRGMDGDHNGLLSREELAGSRWGQALLSDLAMLDRNGDGSLSMGEMTAARHTTMKPDTADPDPLLWALNRAVDAADRLIDAARDNG